MEPSYLHEAIRRRRPGFTLETDFYNDPAIFKEDMDRIISRHWHIFGHESLIPNVGDYQQFQIGPESLILVRAAENVVRAYFNVCRHRGSRLALTQCGHSRRLVCPYHAWTYALDGRLIAASSMPEDFDKAAFSLKEAQVAVIEGLVFVRLKPEGEPLDFMHETVPYLQYHGLANTKVAARELFDIPANWKLVIENFIECYHCPSTHPEYMAGNTVDFVEGVTAFLRQGEASNPAAAALRAVVQQAQAEGGGFPEGKLPVNPARVAITVRKHLRKGYLTGSQDGQGVAPLLGRVKAYDGLSSIIIFNPFCWMSCYDDYAMIYRITPCGHLRTHMEALWLVRKDAVKGVDYAEDRLTWLWHNTLAQDKELVANNQLGTQSAAYQPGPYSLQEDSTEDFVQWYLKHMAPATAQAH
jgi:Rieske 2Fe-2S family protein